MNHKRVERWRIRDKVNKGKERKEKDRKKRRTKEKKDMGEGRLSKRKMMDRVWRRKEGKKGWTKK